MNTVPTVTVCGEPGLSIDFYHCLSPHKLHFASSSISVSQSTLYKYKATTTTHFQSINMYSSSDDNIPTREDFLFIMQAFQQQQQAEPKRRVRFSAAVASAPANPLAFEDLKEFWYSPNELCVFKMEARHLARGGATSLEDLRGLEHTSPQRQKHRYMTIRCTLSAARRGMSPEDISSVARKCTQWNGEIAFVQACRDYAQIYSPQMMAVIPQIRDAPEFPFAVKSKRCADGTATCRRVRRRVELQ